MKKIITTIILSSVITGCATNPNTQNLDHCQKLEPFTLKDYARSISMRGSEKTPIPKRLYKPKYPRSLLNAGIKGTATVQYDVLESGKVDNIRIISKSDTKFGSSFKKAVQCWSFEPTDKKMTLQQTFFWEV